MSGFYAPKQLVEAPFSIGGLFGGEEVELLEQNYEVSPVSFGPEMPTLQIRQFAWHEANANRVWPGTFLLGSYLTTSDPQLLGRLQDKDTRCLELGAATGALSIFLSSPPYNFVIHTCDIQDDGTVEANIIHNFSLNSMQARQHISHTWGTPWAQSIANAETSGVSAGTSFALVPGAIFNYVLASDILLYVSAYPSLVETLLQIFEANPGITFIMSWNRRMDASKQFFSLMEQAGFACLQNGCVFTFTRRLLSQLPLS